MASAISFNGHCHVLCPDGVFTQVGDITRLTNIDPITGDEVAGLIEKIAKNANRDLKRLGYLDKDGEVVACTQSLVHYLSNNLGTII